MKLIKNCLLLVACITFGSASADDVEPQVLLQQVAKKMTIILDANKEQLKINPNLSADIVRENLLPHIDTAGIGKRLIKRAQWNGLSSAQQERFNNAFIEHLIRTYAAGLANYDGHEFVFNKTQFSRSGKTAWVYSELVAKDMETFDIIYTLKLSDEYKGWKVIDIAVNGIKILQNYREQLKSIDINEGFEELLIKIENENSVKPS
ncbi:MAG: ABC transporter substrate-binding protein [Gammaproteobacteria bacterium]|nr:ABC transporter substrate-binding protein [Gammaproteobacteria bacterium]